MQKKWWETLGPQFWKVSAVEEIAFPMASRHSRAVLEAGGTHTYVLLLKVNQTSPGFSCSQKRGWLCSKCKEGNCMPFIFILRNVSAINMC